MSDPPLPAQLRSQEDFDYLITSRGGDPWHMDGNTVENARLDASLAFITKYIAPSFKDTFVEGGCFNGDFTKRLISGFPQSRIIANDISSAAIQKTKERLGAQPRVTLSLEEMGALQVDGSPGRYCLILLESLYYMQPEERKVALAHLVRELRRPKIFISGPIHGTSVFGVPYLREADLFDTLSGLGYKTVGIQALNFVAGFEPGANWFKSVRTKWMLQHDRQFREKWAHQVIYYFQPK
jgi:Nodulation protein S (NodS)